MRVTSLTLCAALAAVAACGDPSRPVAPTGSAGTSAPPPGVAAAAQRNERLARRVALALGHPAFRAYVFNSLQRSPWREHKLPFQRFAAAANARALADIARASGEPVPEVAADLAGAQALEFYLPVPAHRAAWRGDARILVATAVQDHDVPVAFDTDGRRYLLDPDRPPEIPVLALVPQETDFTAKPAMMQCLEDCTATGGSTSTSGSSLTAGLYMTRSHVSDIGAFEGWLKGAPEFEVHILGQQGTTDALTDYQCAGEHAGGPYAYDQNTNDWSGNVLLFSQTQLDNYKAAHPGQSVRVVMLEDDDGACEIKVDEPRFNRMLAVIDSVYLDLTGGRDTLTTFGRYYHAARSAQDLIGAIASWLKSNDDVVGTAVEDRIVGAYYPGYNWFVKGDNTATNGWINLVVQ